MYNGPQQHGRKTAKRGQSPICSFDMTQPRRSAHANWGHPLQIGDCPLFAVPFLQVGSGEVERARGKTLEKRVGVSDQHEADVTALAVFQQKLPDLHLRDGIEHR